MINVGCSIGVVAAWNEAGLLVPNPNLKFARLMFLVAKPNNEVQLIIDDSGWTQYIIIPRFPLKSASGEALPIPVNSLTIKIDTKSGFLCTWSSSTSIKGGKWCFWVEPSGGTEEWRRTVEKDAVASVGTRTVDSRQTWLETEVNGELFRTPYAGSERN